MNNKIISRRDLIKLAGLSFGALAFSPRQDKLVMNRRRRLMRVGKLAKKGEVTSVSIHKSPNEDSQILYQRYKDELINVYGEIESGNGPEYNPFWYRVWGGYVHRAYLQEVEHTLNPVVIQIKEDRQLGEITVPFTAALKYSSLAGWEPIYRLYFKTTHWIIDIIIGPDGQAWYLIEDELDRLQYAVPAEHVRILDNAEFDPISPEVPPEEKRIEISISQQELTAFEGVNIVMKTSIASGALTPVKQTPSGEFRIQSTYPSKHMGGTKRNDIHAYVLPGVPWTCFFEDEAGIATHGTYWHNNFGIPGSSGCVNMRTHEAKWLFRWVDPVGGPHEIYRTGFGTRVSVI